MKNYEWTDEMDRKLLELLKNAALTLAMIGVNLNRTKNSVIGRVRRMRAVGIDVTRPEIKLAPRKQTMRTQDRTTSPTRQPPWRPKGVDLAPLCEPETIANHDQCHWINADPSVPGWAMCGRPSVNKSHWCDEHFVRVYNKLPATT